MNDAEDCKMKSHLSWLHQRSFICVAESALLKAAWPPKLIKVRIGKEHLGIYSYLAFRALSKYDIPWKLIFFFHLLLQFHSTHLFTSSYPFSPTYHSTGTKKGKARKMSASGDEQVPLLERAEIPTIPKEAGRDLVMLEREFVDAEVRMRKFSLLYRSIHLCWGLYHIYIAIYTH